MSAFGVQEPAALGNSSDAPQYEDSKCTKGGKPGVKKPRSTRGRCDLCDSSCIVSNNPEDKAAPCDLCIKSKRVCTYDRSQYQSQTARPRTKKVQSAKGAKAGKIAKAGKAPEAARPCPEIVDQYLSNYAEPERLTSSLASDDFDPSLDSSTQVLPFPTNSYLSGSFSGDHLLSDLTTINSLQTDPFQMAAMTSASPGKVMLGIESPRVPGLISQKPLPNYITYDTPLNLQNEVPAESSTVNYSQLAIQSNPFQSIPSLEALTSFRYIDPTILQTQFGSQASQMSEAEMTQTEDLISIALRAVQQAQQGGGDLGGDKGYAGDNDETLHK
ncbi:hypothetical protein N431DRAFT_562792 [Stipitochalara longipes BDJ]|nr:hypothetical protein N431DRAFT_562792 [Stipitochalara longipes BDJ]